MLMLNRPEILPPSPPLSGPGSNSGHSRRISVLYVDESPALANMICMYLDRDGEMMVDTSLSVEDAMNKLRYISYDVIVTDYNREENEGNELLRNVRAKGERIPFVYFVAFRVTRYEDEAHQFGQVTFIEKMGSSGANLTKLRQAIFEAVPEDRISPVVRAEQCAVGPDGTAKS